MFRVWGLGFGAWCLVFGVSGSQFRLQDPHILECVHSDMGFRVRGRPGDDGGDGELPAPRAFHHDADALELQRAPQLHLREGIAIEVPCFVFRI